jgi:TonB-linked SusC/RagA family outer membrane protein
MNKKQQIRLWVWKTMKLSFLQLVLIALCCEIAQAYEANGQNVLERTITLQVEKAHFVDVLSMIEKQAHIRFVYSPSAINTEQNVTVKAVNKKLHLVLREFLTPLSVDFTVVEDRILLKRAATPPTVLNSVEKSVQGKVTDVNGEGLPGVNVIVKGSMQASVTDMNGNYTIVVPDNNAILVYSFVGYISQEIAIGNTSLMNVVLKPDIKTLDEVVVVGYGTQKKSNVTGAVTTLKMADVMGSRPTTNVAQLLQGNVPGLQVTSRSGEPGTTPSLNIRGTTSVGSGSNGSPLILLDNMPVSSLSMINPNDIESVTVLKDAGSAAVYGARSAWGVILLTSKNGVKKQKNNFEYSASKVFNTPSEIPEKASPLETVKSFKDMNFAPGTGQNVNTWLELINDYNKNPSAYPSGYIIRSGVMYPLKETNVWKEMMSRNAVQNTHNLTINGGNDKMSYRIAGAFTNDDGILITNKDTYKRYNVSGFISSEITSWATAQLTTMYSNSNKKSPYTGLGFGIFGSASVLPSYTLLGDTLINGIRVPYSTPKNLIEGAEPNNNRLDNVRLSGKLITKPLKGLTVTGEYTYDKINTVFTQYDKAFDVTNMTTFLPTPTVTQSQASYYKYNDFTDYRALNIYGTYEKSLNQHLASVMGGFNQEESYFELLNAKMSNMINPNLPYLDGGTGTIQADANGFDGFSEYAVRGYFYRFNYSFADKYFLETTGRYDGSSKFAEGNRWGMFPSVSAGWRISKEPFLKVLQPVLHDLKLRGSYGSVGNQSIGNYLYYAGMAARPTSNWADASGTRYLTLNAPGLISSSFTWEKVTTRNIGVDLSLFGNRFSGSFDRYKRETKGMLIPGAQLPAVLGTNAPLQNTADLKSTGWELSANWKEKVGKVDYHIGFNLYDNRAVITKYDINETRLLSQYYVGQQIGEIWGYETDGFYSVDDFVEGSLNANLEGGKTKPGVIKYQGQNPNPGDIKFKDLDGDEKIFTGDNTATNPGDRRIIGNNNRRMQFGVTGGVRWKGFDMSFFVQGIGKRDIFAVTDLTFPYASNYGTLYKSVMNYWTPENTDAHYGRIYNLGGGNSSYNKLPQTRFLQNGAYTRLKNITLGYTIPAAYLSKAKIQSVRLFASGEDLFTWKELPRGIDPELSDLGYGGQYPIMKKISFGFIVNL